jgi:multimeric flavodoxin WrbA
MHIVAITGSPRGKQSVTRSLVERVLEGAKSAGAETELVDVSSMDMSYCIACNTCHIKGQCVLDDDIVDLQEKMLQADGIVLGSPVYFNSVTAQMKTVMDRLSQVIHLQSFLGKYACSVVTAGGPEIDITLAYMNDELIRLGCTVVGGVGATISIPGSLEAAELNAVSMGRDLVKAIEEKRTYPDQDTAHAAMHERFKRLVAFNKDNWPYEYEYWVNQGWI